MSRLQPSRRRSQRGSAFLHVLIAAVLLGAFAETWRVSFLELNRSASRDPDRARAREVAEAAWTLARRSLERGERAPAVPESILGGHATVEARELAAQDATHRWRVRARGSYARGRSGSRGDAIICELILEVTVDKGKVRVLSRQELGA